MFDKKKKDAVVIVSHPDDESIFMGGTILTYPDWDWRIVSLTYSLEDKPRGVQFKKAMEYYKSLGVNIVGYSCQSNEDALEKLDDTDVEVWSNSIDELNLKPDIVFTHNAIGEYKHEHHIVLNKIVNNLFDNVWEFICPATWRKQVVHQPFKKEIKVVPLTPEVLNNKTDIFNQSYTSELNLWKAVPDIMRFEFCSGFEVFTK